MELRRLRLVTVAVAVAALVTFPLAPAAFAHRDGCHRWHSCPSDTGSYVCGDLGYASECGGVEDYDFDPPSQPQVKNRRVKTGQIILDVKAERGSEISISDPSDWAGDPWATFVGTGAWQTLRFRLPDGSYDAAVTATDRAGNVSDSYLWTGLVVDTTKPEVSNVEAPAPTSEEPATWLSFSTEAGAKYVVAVGRMAIKGTSEGATRVRLPLPNGKHRVRLAVTDAFGNTSRLVVPVSVSVTSLQVAAEAPSPRDAVSHFRVSAPPDVSGELTIPDMAPVRFRTDGTGAADVAVTLAEGQYQSAQVRVVDFAKRTGVATVPSFVLDRTAPQIAVEDVTDQVPRGDLAIAVSTEPGATVAVVADGLAAADWTSDGSTVTRSGTPGKSGPVVVTVTATDPAGNQATQRITVDVQEPIPWGWFGAGLAGIAVLLWLVFRPRRGPASQEG